MSRVIRVYLLPDDDSDYLDNVTEEECEEEQSCTCGYFCMDCLGLSWRDFM